MSRSDNLAKQWTAGALAGMVESVVTMPFEVLKTKLQISGGGKWYSVMFHSENPAENLRGAFRGLSPMLAQTSMKVGIRFAAFETFRPYVSPLFAGFGAGALEALVWIAPTERLKVLRINSSSQGRGILDSLRMVTHNQGIIGLWRGGSATVARNSLTVGLRFWLVERMVNVFRHLSPSTADIHSAAAGFLAGAFTTILNQPIDVVKTHMSADQVGGEKPKYRSNMHCARNIWSTGGIQAYSAGCGARLMKISLGQAVIFFVYERMRKILG